MTSLVLLQLLLLTAFPVQSATIFDAFASSVGSLFRDQEEAPYVLRTKTQEFEERNYTALKWVCSKPIDMNDSTKYQTATFLQLFSYLAKGNAAGVEIDMAIPVSVEYTQESPDKTPLLSACFYIGSPFQVDPPAPLNANLTIVERTPLTVYTRKFGGFANSPIDWLTEARALQRLVSDAGKSVRSDLMYWNAFDSPVKFWYRRNEVWLVKL